MKPRSRGGGLNALLGAQVLQLLPDSTLTPLKPMNNAENTMALLHLDVSAFSDLNSALRKEWLETNGLGGYSSSTICGLNTRRYHGLLVAATRPPRGRMVMLSKLEEILSVQGHEYQLSCNEYPGVVHPRGHRFLTGFRLDPFPTYTFEVEGICLEKAVFMPREKNAVVVRYRLTKAVEEVHLRLNALIACRDHHHLCRENSAINPTVEAQGDEIKLTPYAGAPSLFLALDGGRFLPAADWYRNFRYREEMGRGLDYEEDLFCPGTLNKSLKPGESWDVVAAIHSPSSINVSSEWQKESARRNLLLAHLPEAPQCIRQLHLAADSFLVRGKEGRATVIAGYHWFTDWGRDTMIALPGLTLATGRLSEAREILAFHLEHMNQGLIPNFFPEQDDNPAYNSIDATLWLFVAACKYIRLSQDISFLRESLYPALSQAIKWHLKGTHHGILVDEDGLLLGGDEATQLTWMDAKADDRAVTSRHGKAIEVNALWYNCCMIMQEFAQTLRKTGDQRRFRGLAQKAKASFQKTFWNPEKACLFDCVREGAVDASIRPNQLVALSLPFPLFTGPKARSLLRVVEEDLLIPLGLRSLTPKDDRYIGRYEGDQRRRDSAYHQGTAWAWLIGSFLAAHARVHRGGTSARHLAREVVDSLEVHLSDAGLGTISEIFDGDFPHDPRGCISQAWSVGALLEAYWGEAAGSVQRGNEPSRAHHPTSPLDAPHPRETV